LGNRVATLVRRLISRLIRSSMFVVLSRLRWLDGRAKAVSPSGTWISIHSASFGAVVRYFFTARSN
jgi:hypothetical protein